MQDLGFTGTRNGMTEAQLRRVAALVEDKQPVMVHHGDCVGADEELHSLVWAWAQVVIHPPVNEHKRAFCAGAYRVLPPKPYLERNHDIVLASEELVAAPSGFTEVLRSGTWATIRYARKIGKPVTIVWPDGTLEAS